MLDKLNLYDYITCLGIGDLVSLSVDCVLFSMGCTLVNFDLESFLLCLDLLTIADLTLFRWVYLLALAIAVIARTSSLLVHAWSHLEHHSSSTLALAALASDNSLGISATDTITLCADSVSFQLKFELLAIVQVL